MRSQSRSRPWFIRLAALATAAFALLWVGAASASAAGPRAGAAGMAATAKPSGHVVVVNIDGLMWGDITQAGMPALFSLVGKSDGASLVTRGAGTTACPADGWLTLNSGTRSSGGMLYAYPGGTPLVTALITTPNHFCAALPATPTTTGPYTIPNFASYTAANSAYTYAPVFGSLEEPIAKAGGCVAASGAGALLGAADSTGQVSNYLGAPGSLTTAGLSQCALTLVDLGGQNEMPRTLPKYQPASPYQRAAAYSIIDAQLARLVAHLPSDATLVIAGLTDSTFTSHLHAVLVSGRAAGTDFNGAKWLYTTSTRRAGLVQTLDLTPSLLSWVGLSQSQIVNAAGKPFTGAVITTAGSTPRTPAGTVVTQSWVSVAETVFNSTNENFIAFMAHAIAALAWAAGLVFVAVRWLPERLSPGRFAARWAPLSHWRTAALAILAGWAALLAASVPASFLADFVPWPGSANPAGTLYHSIIGISVLIAAAVWALWWFTPLRARPLAPVGLIGCLTLAIIAVDVMTGSNLQAQTPYGLSYVIAGRFYGIGNSAVGVYCAAAMVASAWVASLLMPSGSGASIAAHVWPRTFREALTGWLRRAVPGRMGLTTLPQADRSQRRRAVLAVALIALFATAACGDPQWGSKFGGTIAMVPGFVLLLFLVAGLRITWRKLLLVAISGVVVVSGFAVVNYLQPAAERSHFGNFVGSLFDGTWTTTIHRKIETNLGSINNDWFSHYVPWLLFWSLVAVVAPRLIGSRSLARVYALQPFLRCALFLSLITVVLATFVDDSGILVPKMALFFAVPLAVFGAALTLSRTPERDEVGLVTAPEPEPDAQAAASGAPVTPGTVATQE